jgi:hypothetical protein
VNKPPAGSGPPPPPPPPPPAGQSQGAGSSLAAALQGALKKRKSISLSDVHLAHEAPRDAPAPATAPSMGLMDEMAKALARRRTGGGKPAAEVKKDHQAHNTREDQVPLQYAKSGHQKLVHSKAASLENESYTSSPPAGSISREGDKNLVPCYPQSH